jgi:cell division protein FtsA
MSRYIFGLDIGTSSVKGVLWRPAGREATSGTLAAYAEHPVETGIQKGVIRDVEEISNRVGHLVEELERMVGERVTRGIVSVGGVHLESRLSKGSVIVSRPDRMVTPEDVQRALEMSRGMATVPNRQVIHIIPRSYALDGVGGISNPVDMEGYHLDAETFIIDGLAPAMSVLEKVLEMADVKAERMIAGPLAGARAALSRRDREEGAVAIDIGASTTSLAVFEEDNLVHTAVLKCGGHDITKDIAIALKLPVEAAETLKIEVGSATPQGIEKKEAVMLSRHIEGADENISKRYIAEIIEAKVEEIFDFVAQELKKVDRLGKLPAGAVIFGGGARLRAIEAVARKPLRMTCRIGTFDHLARNFPETPGLQFFNACGLILWGLDELAGENQGSGRSSGLLAKAMGFLRMFLP